MNKKIALFFLIVGYALVALSVYQIYLDYISGEMKWSTFLTPISLMISTFLIQLRVLRPMEQK